MTVPRSMMQCGHTAQGTRKSDNAPVCVPCLGIIDGADRIVANGPDLTDRTMRCTYDTTGRTERPSNTQAAFFSHQPSKPHDEFYCGCWGWD